MFKRVISKWLSFYTLFSVVVKKSSGLNEHRDQILLEPATGITSPVILSLEPY